MGAASEAEEEDIASVARMMEELVGIFIFKGVVEFGIYQGSFQALRIGYGSG